MGQHTDIEWCDSTVNPTTGCDGCELWGVKAKGSCYAGHLHEGRLAKSLPDLYAPSFTEVRLAPGRMARAAAWSDLRGKPRPDKPWLDGLPRLIFVGDMGDLASSGVPLEYLDDEVMGAARSVKGRRHNWLWLTKRPSRLVGLAEVLADRGEPWPDNVWAGTSVTNRATAVSRINKLVTVPARVRFLSMEPLREWVDISPFLDNNEVQWVIVGGESRQGEWPGTPFNLCWVEQIIKQCGFAKVPCFFKQAGSRAFSDATLGNRFDDHTFNKLRDSHGGDWSEWPSGLRVRQVPGEDR